MPPKSKKTIKVVVLTYCGILRAVATREMQEAFLFFVSNLAVGTRLAAENESQAHVVREVHRRKWR